MQNAINENSKIRILKLKKEISNFYQHLAPDEVGLLASDYQKYETRMIEVIQVRKKSVCIMDLLEFLEFTHVIFPKSILKLLKPHDVFLATFGLNDKLWEIVYLSPPYEVSHFGSGNKNAFIKIDGQ